MRVDPGVSSSSSITNAASNSDGSGPLKPSSTTFVFGRVRFVGDSVRAEFDLEIVGAPAVDVPAFALACSSAILESMAPFNRCTHTDEYSAAGNGIAPGNLLGTS